VICRKYSIFIFEKNIFFFRLAMWASALASHETVQINTVILLCRPLVLHTLKELHTFDYAVSPDFSHADTSLAEEKEDRSKSMLTIPKMASTTATSLQGRGEQRNGKWKRDKKAHTEE
jgi:hypothetical protein